MVSTDEPADTEQSEPVTRNKCARKTTQNRQAQQRFRQRHKVGPHCLARCLIRTCLALGQPRESAHTVQARMSCLETELTEISNRVSELQVKQLQLEARNALLQAVADSALKSTPSEVIVVIS